MTNSEDYFTFHEKGNLNASTDIRPTKRNLLSVAGKLYDPSGWLAPYIIIMKIFSSDRVNVNSLSLSTHFYYFHMKNLQPEQSLYRNCLK